MPAHVLTPAGASALARLEEVAARRARLDLSQDGFLAEALPAIADGLGCDRVSLWLYVGSRGAPQQLHCRGLFVAGGSTAELPTLVESDHPAYFAELDRHGVLRAPDAPSHPALASMRDGYLLPNDIRSLLDVPFAVNGQRVGLLCGEQTGQAIEWQPPQIAFMRRAGIAGSLLFHRLAARQG